jgi:septal ring factor EnvC (AmiA/AmiB activator)
VGDVIAHVGDTGGQSRSALYFEVRRNGRPLNPRQWVN